MVYSPPSFLSMFSFCSLSLSLMVLICFSDLHNDDSPCSVPRVDSGALFIPYSNTAFVWTQAPPISQCAAPLINVEPYLFLLFWNRSVAKTLITSLAACAHPSYAAWSKWGWAGQGKLEKCMMIGEKEPGKECRDGEKCFKWMRWGVKRKMRIERLGNIWWTVHLTMKN